MSEVFFKLTDQFSYEYTNTLKIVGEALYDVTIPTWLEVDQSLNYMYTGVDPTTTGKQPGWRSDYTQIIANSFQDWNRIRNCPDSTGQYVINTLAMSFEEVHQYWREKQRNLWLETADKLQPWCVYRMPMPSYIDVDDATPSYQMLVNAGFRNSAVSRYDLPADWTDGWGQSNDFEPTIKAVLTETGSVDLHVSQGEALSRNLLFTDTDDRPVMTTFYSSTGVVLTGNGETGAYFSFADIDSSAGRAIITLDTGSTANLATGVYDVNIELYSSDNLVSYPLLTGTLTVGIY